MFGLSRRERRLYDRIIEEKDKTIVALASEVEWHRAGSGTYTGAVFQPPAPEPDEAQQALEQLLADAQVGSSALHVSEDEEEILWNMRHGGMSAAAAKQALGQIQGVEELNFDMFEN